MLAFLVPSREYLITDLHQIALVFPPGLSPSLFHCLLLTSEAPAKSLKPDSPDFAGSECRPAMGQKGLFLGRLNRGNQPARLHVDQKVSSWSLPYDLQHDGAKNQQSASK